MDFVERIFGISPDNGSGTFEASILLAITALIAAAVWIRARRSGRPRDK
jgi:hypothetical protein